MKTKLILFLLILSSAIANAQINVFFNTAGDGDWNLNSTWTTESPGQSLIRADYTIEASDIVYSNDSLKIPNVENNGVLNINGSLTINGDFIVDGNSWEINVAPDAEFKITGDLRFFQHGRGKADPELTINGIVIVEGDLIGEGDIYGDGILYVDGEVEELIHVHLFTGIIADGLTNHSLPPPYDFWGEISKEPLGVDLTWQFDSASVITQNFTHLGFQIFRDNEEGSHPDTYKLIPGLNDSLTVDIFSRYYFDEGPFSPADNPRYYIRAVYQNLILDTVAYSPVARFEFPGPLPVSLLFLEAKPAVQAIEIAWATASETNNMGFEVQRLRGEQWETIGFVDGQYNYNAVYHYSFSDNNPLNGINYYRLKQMDYDGKYEYLGPVAAKSISEDSNFNIRVVNAPGNLHLMLPGNNTGRMEIFDITGKAIQNSVAGGRVDLSLAPGTYIVRFIAGDQITTTKFRF